MQEAWLAHVVVHFCVFIAVVRAAEWSGSLDVNCFAAALLLIVQKEVCGTFAKEGPLVIAEMSKDTACKDVY